jgi:hypothetical protein
VAGSAREVAGRAKLEDRRICHTSHRHCQHAFLDSDLFIPLKLSSDHQLKGSRKILSHLQNEIISKVALLEIHGAALYAATADGGALRQPGHADGEMARGTIQLS